MDADGTIMRSATPCTVPLAGWHAASGLDDDHGVLPDGVYRTPDASRMPAEAELGEQVVRAASGLEVS